MSAGLLKAASRSATYPCADDVPDTAPAESLAADLGVPSHLGHGHLHDGSSGLEELVDLHRGETVVVVSHGGYGTVLGALAAGRPR